MTAALERLATMRCGSHYSMWPGGREPWIEGSLFAYLFILEADRQGFTLPEGRRREIVSNLRFFLNCRDNNHVERALATYALSLAAPELALEYVKLLPLEEEVPQAGQIRFLAAMSLIQGGFAAEGNTLLKALEKTGGLGAFGGGAQDASPLDSPVRSTGLALWLLAEKLPEHPLVEKLAADLLRLESADASYYTTHEHAWAALGLSQYLAACLMNSRNGAGMKKPEGPSLLESGARHAATLDLQPLGGGAERRTWEDSGFGQQKPCRVTDFGGDILVTNTGDAELLVETSRRVAQPRTKPVRNGLAVARKFYSAAGLPVLECTAGDLLEVQITLKGKAAGDVVICDLLPGGFEIEDPTLLTRTVVPPYQAPKEGEAVFFVPKLLERRFDRMLAFGNFRGCEDNQAGLVLRYHVRAVAPGRYSIPQTQAEPMYNPRMNALSAAPEEPFVIHPRQP